jgi:hypothetical protein
MKKFKSLLFVGAILFVSKGYSQILSPAFEIVSTDTSAKSLPFIINDDIRSLSYGINGNTFGRQMRLSRNALSDPAYVCYDMGLDASNDFFITRRNSFEQALKIDGDGNVGIGTTAPQSKLAVNGTITSTKLKVTQAGWADFVFEPSYRLPSLDSVAQYLQENKHLQNIPSEKDVKEQGIDVTDMQAKLLQKLEEMTLYMIEMNKKLAAQEEEIRQLKAAAKQ